jgi:hypothetical protein
MTSVATLHQQRPGAIGDISPARGRPVTDLLLCLCCVCVFSGNFLHAAQRARDLLVLLGLERFSYERGRSRPRALSFQVLLHPCLHIMLAVYSEFICIHMIAYKRGSKGGCHLCASVTLLVTMCISYTAVLIMLTCLRAVLIHQVKCVKSAARLLKSKSKLLYNMGNINQVHAVLVNLSFTCSHLWTYSSAFTLYLVPYTRHLLVQ